jgi:hypothetical protein
VQSVRSDAEEEALERDAFLRRARVRYCVARVRAMRRLWLTRCPRRRRSVVAAFRGYEADAVEEVARWEYNYAQLSPRHKCAQLPLAQQHACGGALSRRTNRRALLPRQPAYFAAARAAAATNAAFFTAMLATYESPHVPDHLRVPPAPPPGAPGPRPTAAEAEKARPLARSRRVWSRAACVPCAVARLGRCLGERNLGITL